MGLPRRGGSKLANDMSKSTRLQLHLALGLAGYGEFAAKRFSVLFVADGIAETFDEPRSEKVFRLLGRMALIGNVICFTHHRHLWKIVYASSRGPHTDPSSPSPGAWRGVFSDIPSCNHASRMVGRVHGTRFPRRERW